MAKGSDVPGLTVEDETRDAAVKILWTRFEDMWAYSDTVRKEFDKDGVHDMRVASRRLRTAMQTFRPCFPRRTYREHYDRIKDLADLLGSVRDRDVLIDELKGDVKRLPEEQRGGVDGLVVALTAERKISRAQLRALLEEMEASGYDRTFLTYLARNA